MIGIVLITHGELGAKLIETAEWIIGKKCENVETVSFFQNEGLDELSLKISKAIEKVNKRKGIVLLTDLLHGSCSRVAGEFLAQDGIEVICGVNLPMIISLITHQNEDVHYILQRAKDSSIKNIVDLREMLKGG
ncbi:MAG: PTS galactitol transporter subunit IIBC [bacterium]|nr:PTS galactitol transporter subunit IIBC [bacterium]